MQVQEQMKRYEEAMKDPAVQAQAQQMAQVMQSQEMMQKMAKLRVRVSSFHITGKFFDKAELCPLALDVCLLYIKALRSARQKLAVTDLSLNRAEVGRKIPI